MLSIWTFDNVQIEVDSIIDKSRQDINGYSPAYKNNMIYFTEGGSVTRKWIWSRILQLPTTIKCSFDFVIN